MLGKLIKYDLKHGIKLFVLLHAIMLFFAALGRFFFLEKIDFSGNQQVVMTALIFFISMAILLYTSLNLGVSLLIASRFYRNLFDSEGYLTWTLPATPTQHLWSKIISGSIWLALNLIITACSIVILVSGDNVTTAYSHIAPEFIKSFGMDPVHYGWYMLWFSMFCILGGIIMIYFCITLGQLFPAHRVLSSVMMYFITTIVIEGLAFAVMFLTRLFPVGNDFLHYPGGNMTVYLFSVFKFTAIFTVIVSIIEYAVIHYIFHRKINLI